MCLPGRNYILPSQFRPEGIFEGGGGVCISNPPPCGRNFIPPPPLEGYFQGGVVYKIWPPCLVLWKKSQKITKTARIFLLLRSPQIRKILAPIKIKSALPPGKTQDLPPPPKTRNFMDMGFPAERTHFFRASIKLTHPFPAPELQTEILRTRGFF